MSLVMVGMSPSTTGVGFVPPGALELEHIYTFSPLIFSYGRGTPLGVSKKFIFGGAQELLSASSEGCLSSWLVCLHPLLVSASCLQVRSSLSIPVFFLL